MASLIQPDKKLAMTCELIMYLITISEGICHAGPVKEVAMPKAWVPDGYWERSEEKKREDLAIVDAEKQLEGNVSFAECLLYSQLE
jgi:hypothetical protein